MTDYNNNNNNNNNNVADIDDTRSDLDSIY